MKFINWIYLYLFLIVVTVSACGNSCQGEMQEFGDQLLNESTSGRLTHLDYPNLITFRDSSGNEFLFNKVLNQRSIERSVASYTGECDNGNQFTPFHNREVFEVTYASNTLDTLSIVIKPLVTRLVTFEDELSPEDQSQIGRDAIFVKLSFPGCEIINTSRLLSDDAGETRINVIPFSRSKFGQSYSDTYGVRTAWSNEVWFSFSRGIVAFNYCEKDYAQVVN
ncbi:hypothetical protein FUA23_18310 [Neolewinella aurantiaca]|uniref:Lipoprotein n=1 Tax=Neolewinella aurantiaca TaxID=2602767 RepID=A0A5C7FMD5_9BACT|nr:hypothetical protein [Neolewinella aurantiaca]TXF87544.1 hypothetical protein FUA23_18310 [Neolewinella aurantiaca]